MPGSITEAVLGKASANQVPAAAVFPPVLLPPLKTAEREGQDHDNI